MARKGFAINGAVNAYPDLMVRTESGKLLLIETKGDSTKLWTREKPKSEKVGRDGPGRMYKYYMVLRQRTLIIMVLIIWGVYEDC